MSWRKMYQNNLPKIYSSLVRNYQLHNIKLNILYPRPENLQTKKDYEYYNNLFINALTFPEYHYLGRSVQNQTPKK